MSELETRGRKLKYKTVDELVTAIDKFFASLYEYKRDMWGNRLKDKEYKAPKDGSDDDNPYAGWVMRKERVATVTGLAVHMDCSRDMLLDYESGKYDDRDANGKPVELSDEQLEINKQIGLFSDTIKKAKLMIYADTEQQLHKPGAATGAIFSLKNNYDWHDKREHELQNPDGSLNPLSGLRTEELRQILSKDS